MALRPSPHTAPTTAADAPTHTRHARGAKLGLALAALGVVFGDIGTSPLYSLRECFHGEHAIAPTHANVLGVLSLVFWALTLVVTVKYLTFIMRADNEGEGGILALLALVDDGKGRTGAPPAVIALVIFGAALLYGDGVITPAISVLSAIEGLQVATSALQPVVVPLTCVVLFVLFIFQKHGTGGVGKVFGPVTLLWFATIAALGVPHIVEHPSVLWAIDPRHAVSFFVENGGHGFVVLGAVVLVITGGEALYADMGHFGRGPIRLSWFAIVFPALLINYFGQGALLLERPELAENPFYSLVPTWALYPTVAIATMATVVASQALISGAFSLTQQAVQLGYFPRVTIVHTSKDTEGQIYIPEINALLFVACIGLVLAFRESTALAAAYGIAVTGTMGITTVVYFLVTTRTWRWSYWKAAPLALSFLLIDVAFFGANALKFFHGGWFPVVMALGIFTIMTTWNTGRRHLAQTIAQTMLPLDLFLQDVAEVKPHRVRGTSVFMSSNPSGVPPILLHHFKHNQTLHQQVVLLSVLSEHVPEVPLDRRVKLESMGEGFFRVTARFGFMQTPNVPWILSHCEKLGLDAEPARTSYYLGRETLLPTGSARMARWRKTLFSFVARNARPATAYFGLPPNRVVELGMQIDF
jgi:KUP system potassium uptake protein